MKNALTALILGSILLAVTLSVSADPIRASATARVGARIVAPVLTVTAPPLPSYVEVSELDRARGFALLPLANPSSKLVLRSGDRDEERLSPPSSMTVPVSIDRASEKVEMVWHVE